MSKGREIEPRHGELLHASAELDIRLKRYDDAAESAAVLAEVPGWEARGAAILGLLRIELEDYAAAVEPLKRALKIDPTLRGSEAGPAFLRKALANSLLQIGRHAEAKEQLRIVLDEGRDADASWLLSRAWLQSGDACAATESLAKAEIDPDDPPKPEPAVYVGAAACKRCHADIFRAQTTSRHARTFARAKELGNLPIPARPVRDPIDPTVSHTFKLRRKRRACGNVRRRQTLSLWWHSPSDRDIAASRTSRATTRIPRASCGCRFTSTVQRGT